jgi:hypothetical protein
MKKLIATAVITASCFAAQADVAWSWWCDNKMKNAEVSFGIGTQCLAVDDFELSLVYSATPSVDGVQWSFMGINNSKMSGVLQLAPWFNRGDEPCVQLGFVNSAEKTVFSMGLLNFANTSTVQLGLLNFNKDGFFSVFPFINLNKSLFE